MQKHGFPFSAGILFENDADSQVARVLSSQVVMVPAFSTINDAHITQAKQFIDQAPMFVHSGTPVREQNARCMELLEYAKSIKKPILSRESFIRKISHGNRKEEI
jgi:iron complex transport system ATP-binding protein